MKIFLLGFMGCGKSYVGEKLASQLSFSFLDLDEKIVEMAGMSISEIFKQDGEKAFRCLEKKALHELQDVTATIVALGGGTPCFLENMTWINENGVSIYLHCSPSILLQRLQNETDKRPLLAKKNNTELLNFINEKLSERSSFYEEAHLKYQIRSGSESIVENLYSFISRMSEAYQKEER